MSHRLVRAAAGGAVVVLLAGCVPAVEDSSEGGVASWGQAFTDVEGVQQLEPGHTWNGGVVSSSTPSRDGTAEISVLIPGDDAPVECSVRLWTEDEISGSSHLPLLAVAAPTEDPRAGVTVFYPLEAGDQQVVAQSLDLEDCSVGERVELLTDNVAGSDHQGRDLRPVTIAGGPTTIVVELQDSEGDAVDVFGYSPQARTASWTVEDVPEDSQIYSPENDTVVVIDGPDDDDSALDPETGQTIFEGDVRGGVLARLGEEALLLDSDTDHAPAIQSGGQATEHDHSFMDAETMTDGDGGWLHAGRLCPAADSLCPTMDRETGEYLWYPSGSVGSDGQLQIAVDSARAEELEFEYLGATNGLLYGTAADGFQAIDLQGQPVGKPLESPDPLWIPYGDRMVDGQLWTTWMVGDPITVHAVLPTGQRPVG